MARPTYEEVGQEFDRLLNTIMLSFDWTDEDLYEKNRLRFRSEWEAYLESVGWTEVEFDDEVWDRLTQKGY